ncbi:MAG TPA: exonuclease SbcCD subunit D [Thermoflexales bacterium]|nr:exonuclease SbcCD subunit D [Thermoflexales bacterium]HQW35847.1 exonuclease SbcCD subunit D [Thermoflexales bacterium]
MTRNEPIRLLHFADIHIGMENFGTIDPATGLNTRVLDFLSRLKEIVDYAINNQIDCVLFAGDAFKTRDPNPTYQRGFARQIMRLSRADIPTVLLVGNHDMPVMERRATSVDIYQTLEVPNIVIGEREEVHVIETKRGKLQIATAPWPQRSRLLKDTTFHGKTQDELDRELERIIGEELQRLAQETDPSLPAVLTGHFSVTGATFGSERNVMVGRDAIISLSALAHPAWDYVALGHIHKHQNLNKDGYPAVVYSGSLERIDFSEEDSAKGFCLVELRRGETTWQFMPLPVRDFVTIEANCLNDGDTPTEAVIRAIERREIKDAIVRVRIKLAQEQESKLRIKEIENALSEARYIAGISREVQRDARQRIGLLNAESLTPAQLVEQYFISKSVPEERMQELLGLARQIIEN